MKVVQLGIIAFASIAFLSMQMSGLHLHAGDRGEDAFLHGAHAHDTNTDGHDHSADVDVSLINFGIVWAKVTLALIGVFVSLASVVWVLHTLFPPPVSQVSFRRRSRWRPQLRAPPVLP